MIVDEGNAWDIHGVYVKAENAIIARIKKYVADDLDVPDYQLVKLAQIQKLRAEALEIFKTVQPAVAEVLDKSIAEAYKKGNLEAYADIGKGLTPDKLPPLQVQYAIANTVEEVTKAFSAAESMILRTVEDEFRDQVGKVINKVVSRGITRSQAVIEVVDNLSVTQTFTFKDQSGRNWSIPNYAEMAVRTATRKAQISGYENVLDKNKLDLVMVQPGPRACKICDDWARAVLTRGTVEQSIGDTQVKSMKDGSMIDVEIRGSVADARKAGFQHPNCRCRLRAYLPGITDPASLERPPWDEDGYKAQQTQRALESEIRKAKSEQLRSGTDDTGADQRVKAAQEALKRHLAANPDLKRQSGREQISGRLGTTAERKLLKTMKEQPKAPKPSPAKTADDAKQTPAETFVKKGDARAVADLSKLPRVDKQRPMDTEAEISNPGFNVANSLTYNGTEFKRTYNNNCSLCVNALEMRARGYDVIAKPIGGGMGRYREQTALDWVDKDGNARPFTALNSLKGKTTVTRLREFSKDLPVGARGFISGQYKKGGGHIFNWEMTEDGLIFHEGQLGSTPSGSLAAAYGRTAGSTPMEMKPDSLSVLRVDDLEPSNQMIELAVEPRTPERLAEIETERANPTGASGIRSALNAARTSLQRMEQDVIELRKQRDDTPQTLERIEERMNFNIRAMQVENMIKELKPLIAKLEDDLRKAQS